MDDQSSQGSIEKPGDAGPGESGVVRRWEMEIHLAEKVEKDWRKEVEETYKVYRGEDTAGDSDMRTSKRRDTMNILWANIETLRPVLYNTLPIPDIRRKFRDKDPIGKVVAELLERCVTCAIANNFDSTMIAAVNDFLLPGRAVTRVKYMPVFEGDELVDEEVICEQVHWDEFTMGPGRHWGEVNWIKFDHALTKEDVERLFPGYEDIIKYDMDIEGDYSESDKTIFKRVKIWEIWDKVKREVLFICPNYKTKPISVEQDPLGLKDFYPIPEPMRAVEDSLSLVPICEYGQYATLAKELEIITNRIRGIIKGLRLRGIYDSRLSELVNLFDSSDNDMQPASNVAAILEQGGIDNAIWMMPTAKHAEVLASLYTYRQGLLQSIYEITGISDIVRGKSSPSETLGAQQLKANYGSQRLQRKQKDVQKYSRALIRIMVEIIAERFSPQTIALTTGMNFLPENQKAELQQLASIAPQQVIPEEIKELLEKPSMEEIGKIMRSDIRRDYVIDIQTNSTIQLQLQEEKGAMVELLQGITQYVGGVAPLVASGAIPAETAKELLMATIRRFDLGSVVEDSLEMIGEQGGEQGGTQALQKQVQQLQQQLEQVQGQAQEHIEGLKQEGLARIDEMKKNADEQYKNELDKIKTKYDMSLMGVKSDMKIEHDQNILNEQVNDFGIEKEMFRQEMDNKKAIFAIQQKQANISHVEPSDLLANFEEKEDQDVLSKVEIQIRFREILERITLVAGNMRQKETRIIRENGEIVGSETL